MRKSLFLSLLLQTALWSADAPAQETDLAAERARIANERIRIESERRAKEEEARRAAAEESVPDAAPPTRVAQAVPPMAPPKPAADNVDRMLDQIRKLGELKDAGYVTDSEFERIKARILDAELQ